MFKRSSQGYLLADISKELNIPVYRLRSWEAIYPVFSSHLREDGERYYEKNDIEIIKHIAFLLYEKQHKKDEILELLKKEGFYKEEKKELDFSESEAKNQLQEEKEELSEKLRFLEEENLKLKKEVEIALSLESDFVKSQESEKRIVLEELEKLRSSQIEMLGRIEEKERSLETLLEEKKSVEEALNHLKNTQPSEQLEAEKTALEREYFQYQQKVEEERAQEKQRYEALEARLVSIEAERSLLLRERDALIEHKKTAFEPYKHEIADLRKEMERLTLDYQNEKKQFSSLEGKYLLIEKKREEDAEIIELYAENEKENLKVREDFEALRKEFEGIFEQKKQVEEDFRSLQIKFSEKEKEWKEAEEFFLEQVKLLEEEKNSLEVEKKKALDENVRLLMEEKSSQELQKNLEILSAEKEDLMREKEILREKEAFQAAGLKQRLEEREREEAYLKIQLEQARSEVREKTKSLETELELLRVEREEIIEKAQKTEEGLLKNLELVKQERDGLDALYGEEQEKLHLGYVVTQQADAEKTLKLQSGLREILAQLQDLRENLNLN